MTATPRHTPAAAGGPSPTRAPRPGAVPGAVAAALDPTAYRWTIVPHTHWDREWYAPFEPFRVRLARTIDGVMDALEEDPEFEAFTLDGQSVILEDYLELRPETEPRLRAHLASGRLIAGPAYVLPDEYLAPPEALVRNLLVGMQVARRLGARPMAVGYQPDPFGHVAQLPQILRGFGLDNLVFTRGLGNEAERVGGVFTWRGPDGSEVLGVRQLGSYGNASQIGRWGRDGRDHLGAPDEWAAVAVDRLRRFLERYGPELERDGLPDILLCNGSDHEPAWRPLTRMVRAIRDAYPGITVEIAGYEAHLAHVREALERRAAAGEPPPAIVEGELREGHDAHILRGIDSARIYLKQANERATQALLGAEAIASLVALAGRGLLAGAEHGRAWRLLLQNQPHDSISGCSVDEVHAEMLTRFDQVEQLAGRMEVEALAALVGREAPWDAVPAADATVTVVNPLPSARQALVTVPIPGDLPGPLIAEIDGRPRPAQRSARGALVSLPLEGFGAVPLHLRAGEPGEVASQGAARAVAPATIENERYRVEAAADGTLTVTDRRTGYAIEGLGALEDVADRGDEYDFCPIDEEIGWSSRTAARGTRRRVMADGPVVAELEIEYRAVLPARLSADRGRRVGRASCRVRTVVRLVAGIDRIELTTTIDNRARDHRLRVAFPSPEGREPLRAEGHFAVLRRPARPAAPIHPERWAQLPQPTHHTTGFVAAGPLVVTGKGLPEYEAIPRPDGGLDVVLTLLRCVGWLSRDDLSTRRFQGAGPALETPAAQCLGRQVFEYAISLDGATGEGPLTRASADYRQPARVVAGATDGAAVVAGVGVEGDVAFTALKPSEAGDGAILRLYNPGLDPQPFAVDGPAELRTVRLDEQPLGSAASGRLEGVLAPAQIASIHLAAPSPQVAALRKGGIRARTRFGVAYFGVRDPDHYRADLAEIARQGFDWVLLPFTHDDALWERATFGDLVATARALGLTTVISPWGGDEFGGEGVQTALSLETWLERARASGADVLHVDEPRLASRRLVEVLELWADDARIWLTIQPERAAELPPDVVRRVAALGTDAYDGSLEDRVAATRAFALATGRLDLAWVQAFRVRAGQEAGVGEAVRSMAAIAPLVGIWGWKGSSGRGDLRSDDPSAVQRAVSEAVSEVVGLPLRG